MRRRRIVRPGLRPGVHPPQRKPVHPLLRKAHELFANGNYLDAAELFVKLGEGAVARNMPRAPHLFLQAGRSYLLAGVYEKAIEYSRHGLNLFLEKERWHELKRFGDRVVVELKEHNLDDEANLIQSWLIESIPESFEVSSGKFSLNESKKDIHLPLVCPSCGGAINPLEVEWVDDITAVCSFCGNMVRGE